MRSAGPIFKGRAEDEEHKHTLLNTIFTKIQQPGDPNLDEMAIISKKYDEGLTASADSFITWMMCGVSAIEYTIYVLLMFYLWLHDDQNLPFTKKG